MRVLGFYNHPELYFFSSGYLIESQLFISSEIFNQVVTISLDFCTQYSSVSIKCMAFIIRIFPITIEQITFSPKGQYNKKKQ